MKTVLATFGLIFLAELGDKTQLAAITIASETGRPWLVFLGASLAMVTVTLLAVFLGAGVARLVPPVVIHKSAGVLFIIFGVLFFFGKL